MENTVNNDLFFVNLRLGFVFPAVGVEAFEEGCLGTLRKWLPEVKKVLDRARITPINEIKSDELYYFNVDDINRMIHDFRCMLSMSFKTVSTEEVHLLIKAIITMYKEIYSIFTTDLSVEDTRKIISEEIKSIMSNNGELESSIALFTGRKLAALGYCSKEKGESFQSLYGVNLVDEIMTVVSTNNSENSINYSELLDAVGTDLTLETPWMKKLFHQNH